MPDEQTSAAVRPAGTRAAKRAERAGAGKAGENGSAGISQEAALGLAAPTRIAGTGLLLHLRAVPVKKTRELHALCEQWPECILFAALTRPRPGDGGIDAAAVAELSTRARRRMDPGDTEAVTPADVARQFAQLSLGIGDYRDVIADSVWLLAEGTPGLTREALPDLIEEHLTISQHVDLLRTLWRANGGFPGDMEDRFPEGAGGGDGAPAG